MSSFFNIISTMLFPKRCKLCGEVVEFDKKLCDECENNLPKILPPICPKCGANKEDCICGGHKNEYKSIVAPLYYKDNVYKIVHNFKLNSMKELGEEMGKMMSETVKEYYSEIDFDYVTFVPLHKKREKSRGFNQSEILAKVIAKNINSKCVLLLIKTMKTKVQRKQTKRERKVNVYGVFDIVQNADIDGKTILLVDDVKTTGATINECAKMLNIYGAKAVYAVTFAITVNKD